MRELEAGQVAEERPVRVQHALRVGRRAGRVDQEGRVVRSRPDAGRGRGAVAEQGVEAAMRGRCLAVHDDRQSKLGSGLGDPVEEVRRDDQHAGAAVGEAVAQRVGPEELAERQRDGAGLGDRELRGRRREALRDEQPDALAASDSEPEERVREPVRRVGQLRERPDAMGAAGAVLDHRRVVRDLFVRAGDADVEALRDPPAEGSDDLLVGPAGRHERRSHGQPR